MSPPAVPCRTSGCLLIVACSNDLSVCIPQSYENCVPQRDSANGFANEHSDHEEVQRVTTTYKKNQNPSQKATKSYYDSLGATICLYLLIRASGVRIPRGSPSTIPYPIDIILVW